MSHVSAATQPPRLASKRGSGYLPGLDGWRAIAILGVLMTHDAAWHLGPLSDADWKGWGGDGVYLFFAISGLLICWRILEEEKVVGSFTLEASISVASSAYSLPLSSTSP